MGSGLKKKFRDLFLPFVDGEQIIFADQNAPQPTKPFWTLKITSSKNVMAGEKKETDIDGEVKHRLSIEGVCRLQRFGEDSFDKVGFLRIKTKTLGFQELASRKNIAVFDTFNFTDLTGKLDNIEHEERAAIDFGIRYEDVFVENVGVVNSVLLDTDLTNGNGGLVLNDSEVLDGI